MSKLMVFVPDVRLATVIASLKERVPSGPAGFATVPPSMSSAVVVTVKMDGVSRTSNHSRKGRKKVGRPTPDRGLDRRPPGLNLPPAKIGSVVGERDFEVSRDPFSSLWSE